MSDVTRILNAIERGDAKATDQLLPLVYEELRVLAAQRLSQEPPGQTLQATALVHEAYLRLVGAEPQNWASRGHFFKAAAEAMRRILIDSARRKKTTQSNVGGARPAASTSGLAAVSPRQLWEGPDVRCPQLQRSQVVLGFQRVGVILADLVLRASF